MTDLVKLCHMTSMIEYHESYEAIINSLNLFEQYMFNCFLEIKGRYLSVGAYVSAHDSTQSLC